MSVCVQRWVAVEHKYWRIQKYCIQNTKVQGSAQGMFIELYKIVTLRNLNTEHFYTTVSDQTPSLQIVLLALRASVKRDKAVSSLSELGSLSSWRYFHRFRLKDVNGKNIYVRCQLCLSATKVLFYFQLNTIYV